MPSIAFLRDCNGKPKATTTNEHQKVAKFTWTDRFAY